MVYDTSKLLQYDINGDMPDKEAIRALLLDRTISCIIIKGMFSKNICELLVKNIMINKRSHDRLEGVFIAGNTFYQSLDGGDIADQYFNSPGAFQKWLRKCSGGASPLDSVLGIFSTMHDRGISKAYLSGKQEMPPAVLRIYPADKCAEILPHQDILKWYIDDELADSLVGQAGWNIYLDIPSSGGELIIYDKQLDKETYDILAKGNYGIPWEEFNSPVLSILPEIGDLILIDSTRLHAIKSVSGSGQRVTLSGFLGYYENQPMISWA